MVLIDDWVSIGSCNFDHWNLRFNLEANLESLDAGLTRAVKASFENDFALSQEVSLSRGSADRCGGGSSRGYGDGWIGWW